MFRILEGLKSKTVRESTSHTYLVIWRQFNQFLIRLDWRPNSWEERVTLFCAHLIQKSCQSSTIKSYISAIKRVLKLDGYIWNERKILVSTLTQACKLQNDQVKCRLPIQKALFELILFELRRIMDGQPYLLSLYMAAFSLAYYGLMRVGVGHHAVKAKNIHIGLNKDKMMLVLYTSKTHGHESYPQKITRKPGGFMQSCVFPCIVKFLVHLLQYLKDTINIIPQTTTKYVVLYENWVTQIWKIVIQLDSTNQYENFDNMPMLWLKLKKLWAIQYFWVLLHVLIPILYDSCSDTFTLSVHVSPCILCPYRKDD